MPLEEDSFQTSEEASEEVSLPCQNPLKHPLRAPALNLTMSALLPVGFHLLSSLLHQLQRGLLSAAFHSGLVVIAQPVVPELNRLRTAAVKTPRSIGRAPLAPEYQ